MAERGTLDEVLTAVDDAGQLIRRATSHHQRLFAGEMGRVSLVGRGVVAVEGLPGLGSEELVRFKGGQLGMALNLEPGHAGIILLDQAAEIEAGDEVRRTGRLMDTPVGEHILGRVIDPEGRPRDGGRPIRSGQRRAVEQPAPRIIDRRPVEIPLQTGIKAIDAMVPIGRGQRELIMGDRQTGKTTIAVDTIVAQRDRGVVCVYCAIGERSSSVAKTVAQLRSHNALEYTVVVATTGDDPAGLQFVAPYAATSVAEWFMAGGRDVLIVYDDLTRHARAYRELSLLLGRPPGREAFPGDIFYVHSRLLERATRLTEALGGGSLTALPIVETEAQNISAYIPTNLISITDGQIYLSPRLFQQGVLPAVDIGRSVSRVGGRAQLPAYRSVAGPLRLAYAQFEELERFARYGARLEESRRQLLRRGRRVREILKQPQLHPVPAGEQVALLLSAVEGMLDGVPVERITEVEEVIRDRVRERGIALLRRIGEGSPLEEEDRRRILDTARTAIDELTGTHGHG